MASLAAPLLSRLKGVRSAGADQWYARCPAHDDRAPSLSIRDTGDRVLIHCFAACAPEAVLEAVGLEWRDLYPEPWACARRRPNEAAQRYARRTLVAADPLALERNILLIAVADIEAGQPLSIKDRAYIEVARARLKAAEVAHG